MAKLEITPELLVETLFPGADVRIVGVRGGLTQRGSIVLDVEGPSVPEAENVTALVMVAETGETIKRRVYSVRFSPV